MRAKEPSAWAVVVRLPAADAHTLADAHALTDAHALAAAYADPDPDPDPDPESLVGTVAVGVAGLESAWSLHAEVAMTMATSTSRSRMTGA